MALTCFIIPPTIDVSRGVPRDEGVDVNQGDSAALSSVSERPAPASHQSYAPGGGDFGKPSLRKRMLKNLSEDIPQGVHSDEYIATKMASRVQAYGLRSSVAFQDVTTRWRRRWEYGLLYGFRSRYPYGDPLWQFVSFLRAATVVMILYFLIR